jgi:hypothetical protein
MGTGLYPGVKRAGLGVDHQLPSSTEVKGTVKVHLYSPSVLSCQVKGRTLGLLCSRKLAIYRTTRREEAILSLNPLAFTLGPPVLTALKVFRKPNFKNSVRHLFWQIYGFISVKILSSVSFFPTKI